MTTTRDLGRKRPKNDAPETFRGFARNIAVIIGVQSYRNSIPPLNTPINDGQKLASLLENKFQYRSFFLKDASKASITKLLTERLPASIQPDDRLLFYFAGHGVAQDSDSGPNGYMVPVDGDPFRPEETYLAMHDVSRWLEALPCRHLLVILDCCFAGTFRWSGTRRVPQFPEIQKERYERFVMGTARQVLTSTTQSEEALDVFGMGRRGNERDKHSPFAEALIRGLEMGEANLALNGRTDQIITATELYFYLEQEVAHLAQAQGAHRQTPRLWPLANHGSGEFVFELPQFNYGELVAAPPLTFENNPYRGLNAYEAQDAKLFFGRDVETEHLKQLLEHSVAKQSEGQVFIVTGPSDSGKSSLVQAGLLPTLSEDWVVLGPERPGRNPLKKFTELFEDWQAENGRFLTPPQQLLVIDNLDEIGMAGDGNLIRAFLRLLGEKRREYNGRLHILFTVRHDFLDQLPLREDVSYIHRYTIPPMRHDSLRQVIENPAAEKLLYFEPPELVNRLIKDVNQTPGALPLLSYTLSEMYKKHLQAQRQDRALTQADHDAVGGVVGALRNNIAGVYESLPDAAHQRTMKHLLLRLVYTRDVVRHRRRVAPGELQYAQTAENKRVQTVIQRLEASGLLIAGDRIELAHDALFTVWGQFVTWQQEAADYLPLQRRLSRAARDWEMESNVRHRQRLLWDRNPHLTQLRTVQQSNDNWLNRQETAFITRSWAKSRWERNLGILIIATSFIILLLVGYIGFSAANANDARRAAEVREQAAVAIAATAEASRLTAEDKAAEMTTTLDGFKAELATHNLNQAANNALLQEEIDGFNETVLALEDAEERLQTNLETLEDLQSTLFTALSEPSSREDLSVYVNLNAAIARLREDANSSAQTQAMFGELNRRFAPFASPDLATYEQAFLIMAQSIQATLAEQTDISFGDLGSSIFQFIDNLPPHFQPLDGHVGGADHVAYSADGTMLASASWQDGTIRLWDLTEPAASRTAVVLPSTTVFIGSLAFSPDNQWLASASADGSVQLWDLTVSDPSRHPLALREHPTWVTAVSFSPDSRWLASGSRDGSIRLWDMAASDPNRAPRLLDQHDNWVTDLTFAPNSELLASASWDQTVRLWDVVVNDPNQRGRVLDNHSGVVSSVTFAPDGKTLASTSWDNSVQLWDVATVRSGDAPLLILENHLGDGVGDLAFSHSGQQLAYTGTKNRVYLWQWEDSETPPLIFEGHKQNVTALAFAPDDQTLVTTSEDHKIKLWNLAAADPTSNATTLHGHKRKITAVAYAPDGQTLATASLDNSVRLWDLNPPPTLEPTQFGGGEEEITAVSFAQNETLLSIYAGHTIEQWQVGNGKPETLLAEDNRTTAAAISPSGNWLARATTTAIQLHGPDGVETLALSAGETAVHTLRFSPDEAWLAATTNDTILLWDRQPDAATKPINLPSTAAALAFSPQEPLLATATGTTIQLWNLTEIAAVSQPQKLDTQHDDPIVQLAFSPDGRQLATGSLDDSIRVWEFVEDGLALQLELTEHEDKIAALSFAPDGKTLAAASANNVYLWNLRTRETIPQPMVFSGHVDRVRTVAFAPDGLTLASAGADGTIRLWPTLLQMTNIACSAVERNFNWLEWQLFMPGHPYEISCSNHPPHPSVCAQPDALWSPDALQEKTAVCGA